MEEQGLSKKERKELKRQEKRDTLQQERRKKKLVKWGMWVVIVAAVGFGAWQGIVFLTPEPLGEDYSQLMVSEGAFHVAEGTRVTYQSNPPTSGNHWPDPLRDGVYDTEKPDEAVIHSLEHGRVWVSYQPDIAAETIEQLKEIVKGEFGVILSPRSANETDIALAAWTRLDTFNLSEAGTVDAKRVKDFIQRYRNKGPEYVPQNTGKAYD